MNRIPRSYIVVTAATGLAVFGSAFLGACASSPHATGSISPAGNAHGTFRYCSYTPVEDGIRIAEEASVPCIVTDAREADDRKKKAKKKARPSATAYVPAPAATGRTVTIRPVKPKSSQSKLSKPSGTTRTR